MSEEEIIKMLKEYSATNPFQKSMFYVSNLHEAIQGLLDLYNKEKEKNKILDNMLLVNKEQYEFIKNKDNYISKDKIKQCIEKLEIEKKFYFEKQVIQGRIDLLQELLEERN